MSTVDIDHPIPDLLVQATDNRSFPLSELRGKNLVLYFYPKDNTPGCTTEGQDFRDHYDDFEALNTVILGVSRDNLASHESFKSKQCFPFDLIADEDEALCKAFDVIKEKNLYGKKSLGIERSTFIVDVNGILRRAYRKVKVENHVMSVLNDLREIVG